MPTVDLVYDTECPNGPAARDNLMRALTRAGVEVRWSEHRIGDPDVPERVRGFGSPTVLVNGRDVGGIEPSSEVCCRIYDGARAPSVESIARALDAAAPEETGATTSSGSAGRGGGWRSIAAVLPGVGVALLPKLACPLCWPAYAGILSAAGLGFLMEEAWLLPISAVLLAAALGALAWRARRRRGYGPALAGLVASVMILLGKFALGSDAVLYAGIAGLVAASVWNAWPRRPTAACSACPGGAPSHPRAT